MGRVLSYLVDFVRLANWLNTCDSSHNHRFVACNRSAGDYRGLRLIDVQQQCISLAAPEKRYAGLSYKVGGVGDAVPWLYEVPIQGSTHLTKTRIAVPAQPNAIVDCISFYS
jgi:hypothetical protein